MHGIDDIRHSNLLAMIAEAGSQAAFAAMVHKAPAQVSQWVSRARNSVTGTPRVVSSRMARELEASFGKPVNWMDQDHFGEGPHEPSNVAPGPSIRGRVPIISWVQAGEFTEVNDPFQPGHADEWQPVTVTVHEHTFALRVRGDSMSPAFPEGSVLVVEPDETPRNGSYVIAKNGGDATFKQYIVDGVDVYLRPLNTQYQAKLIGDARIIGVVVQMLRDLT